MVSGSACQYVYVRCRTRTEVTMQRLGSQLTDDLAQVRPGVTLERVVRLRQDPFVHVVQRERHVPALVVARVVVHLGVFTRMAARGVSLQRRGHPQDARRALQPPGPAVEPPATNHSRAAPGADIGVVGDAGDAKRRACAAGDDETEHAQTQHSRRDESADCWPGPVTHLDGRARTAARTKARTKARGQEVCEGGRRTAEVGAVSRQ